MITHTQAILAVARKELLEHVRTKRLQIVGVFFLLALLLGLWIGIRFILPGDIDVGSRATFVLGFYFGLFPIINGLAFTSALGIMMSADAIVGEWKDKTLFLVFSKPVSRGAVLGGKILAAFVAVLGVFTAVFLLGLIVVLFAVGVPGAEDTGQILGGFGIVAFGILPFVGLGILTSALFRSPTASFLTAFGLWFIGLPILGNLGLIIRLIQRRTQAAIEGDGLVDFFHHLDPRWLMDQGATYMLGGRSFEIFGGANFEVDVPVVLLAMVGHIVFYLGLAFWIVNRRDYA